MRFASRVILIAGIYGLIVLVPQYFTEVKTGRDYPPAITHPEFYYLDTRRSLYACLLENCSQRNRAMSCL